MIKRTLTIFIFQILFFQVSAWAKYFFLEVTWPKVNEAWLYQIEIVDQNKRVIYEDILKNNYFYFRTKTKRKLFFRVASIGANQKKSSFSKYSKINFIKPYNIKKRIKTYKQKLYTPYQENRNEVAKYVKFNWPKVKFKESYLFKLYDQKNRLLLVNDLSINQTQLQLSPGEYAWQLIVKYPEGIKRSSRKKYFKLRNPKKELSPPAVLVKNNQKKNQEKNSKKNKKSSRKIASKMKSQKSQSKKQNLYTIPERRIDLNLSYAGGVYGLSYRSENESLNKLNITDATSTYIDANLKITEIFSAQINSVTVTSTSVENLNFQALKFGALYRLKHDQSNHSYFGFSVSNASTSFDLNSDSSIDNSFSFTNLEYKIINQIKENWSLKTNLSLGSSVQNDHFIMSYQARTGVFYRKPNWKMSPNFGINHGRNSINGDDSFVTSETSLNLGISFEY
ncbi:hypothetical protein N9N67_10225 [Bacteriovoracaceae bacterium]|nr:hypothetical protein [Bacteriovoracaceae bacterium]